MGLPRRALERPDTACRLCRRRRIGGLAGGERSAWYSAARTATADDREYPRAAASVDQERRAVSGTIHQLLQRDARAEAGPIAVSDLVGDERGAARNRAGRFRRIGACAHARRPNRRRLDDAFRRPRWLQAVL